MDFHQLVWVRRAICEDWDETPDPIIRTAVDLLDASWCKTRDYVGQGGSGSNQDGKYSRVGDYLASAIGKDWIPVPSLSLVDGEAIFNDGRHRFAWLRDHGLRALPVEVGRTDAQTFRTQVETAERVGRFDPEALRVDPRVPADLPGRVRPRGQEWPPRPPSGRAGIEFSLSARQTSPAPLAPETCRHRSQARCAALPEHRHSDRSSTTPDRDSAGRSVDQVTPNRQRRVVHEQVGEARIVHLVFNDGRWTGTLGQLVRERAPEVEHAQRDALIPQFRHARRGRANTRRGSGRATLTRRPAMRQPPGCGPDASRGTGVRPPCAGLRQSSPRPGRIRTRLRSR